MTEVTALLFLLASWGFCQQRFSDAGIRQTLISKAGTLPSMVAKSSGKLMTFL